MMIFKTTPNNIATVVTAVSNISLTKLVEMGLKANALGAELAPGYGEFPTWIRDKVAEQYPLMVATVDGQPIWSDDKCPACGVVLGVNPNLAPHSREHRMCVAAIAESRTHDDSRKRGW